MNGLRWQSAGGMLRTSVVAVVLGALAWVWGADCLCSPTAFYQNCWIRRFPGVLLDLQESQKRGAQVLRLFWENTAQQCGRTCCLQRNVSCNLAVFYYETAHSNNCLHVYCPSLESCIIRNRNNAILYNITIGIDPDLLVFEKMSFKDLNPRSSFHKMERLNSSRTPEPAKWQHTKHTPVTLSTMDSTWTQTVDTDQRLHHEEFRIIQEALFTTDAWQKSVPQDFLTQQTVMTSARADQDISATTSPFSTFTALDNKPLSHLPNLAHLNGSKQHLNETKGYSGRNQSTENEHGSQRPPWVRAPGQWLVPVALCSSISLFCCCCFLLAVGHRRKRTGHYRPARQEDNGPRQVIKYTMIKESL